MNSALRKKVLRVVFLLSLGVTLFFGGFLLWQKNSDMTLYLEVDYLQASGLRSFGEFSDYFGGLAREKGGGYAFEVLKVAPMPPDIDMHLLGHVVGDILFAQKGLDGIQVCTHDFRNACSHSIVVGLFLEQGEAALPKIAEACYQAPGGSGAYTMCFHGLGHGVLAYAGYDLKKAVELCKKTGTPQYNQEESSQCISGTIMEMISGINNPELWVEQRPKYFLQDDPLYPCSADFIPEEAQYLCYLYLTPHLFEAAGTNSWTPTPDAFPFCDALPVSDIRNRDACYGGFGKEFLGFVADRDIRTSAVESITEKQLLHIYELCLFAGNREGTTSCIKSAANSLYWGGENDRGAVIRFCSVLPDPFYQRACFLNLIFTVNYYIQDPVYKTEFCGEIPQAFAGECQDKLLKSR